MTKIYRCKMIITGILSFLCSFGPLIVFAIMGFIQGEGKEKVVLTMTMVGAIIIASVSAMRKIHLRSTTFILMIGLLIALDRLFPFILTITICTILDELLFTPLYHRFKENYHINKQIDKRIGVQ